MTDGEDKRTGRDDFQPETLVVPGNERELEDLSEDELAGELQRVQDLGSASRSCVAIIAVLLIMALLICVFLVWALILQ